MFGEIKEAQALGISPKVVLIGPLTYLFMGKETEVDLNRLELLPRLLPAYHNILSRMAASGVQWGQMDAPCLAFELEEIWLEKRSEVYTTLQGSGPQLLLMTYFDAIDEHASRLKALPDPSMACILIYVAHRINSMHFLPIIRSIKYFHWVSSMGAACSALIFPKH